MSAPRSNQPVLILGAGINGAAVARELVLNNVPVIVVDSHDIASGATSRSSRLIHGGLRYLEYGDFALVRESLAERERLLRLAPQFVQPQRLFIPVRRRFGGLIESARRFLGRKPRTEAGERGLWTVRLGLWLYDLCAGRGLLPRSSVHRNARGDAPPVDPHQFRWLCAYSDAQMLFPERFVVALLEDARRAAQAKDVEFHVYTYHRAKLDEERVQIEPLDGIRVHRELHPAAIVNATGAAGDLTLGELGVRARRLFGGTKGSHFVTFHPGLRTALGPSGVYAEAADGRLIFVLPFGDGVLVGTTDEFFDGDPDRAVATEPELAYLLRLVNEVFPEIRLTRDDIALHYAGVRPLPVTTEATPAAVSRRHAIAESAAGPIPMFTLIGGKLTTCRAFAEEVTDCVLARLQLPRVTDTRDRPLVDREPTHNCQQSQELLHGTSFPLKYVRHVIEHEWVTQLEDLVERRLMLVFQPELSRRTLSHLAEMLVAARDPSSGKTSDTVESIVDACEARLKEIYGRHVVTKD